MINRLKITLTFLLVVMTIGITKGQFGVRTGLNLASLKIKVNVFGLPVSVSTDDKIGGHFGVYYKSQVSENLTIRPNLLFTTAGGNIEDETTGESEGVSASYLALPVDLMYSVPVGDNSLSLVGGPYLGFLLSSSTDDGSDEDEFASTDYGINLGIQFNVNEIGIGLSYGIGMANVIPEEDVTSSFLGESSANTRVVSIYFTYDL